MSHIWHSVAEHWRYQTIDGNGFRLVESQEIVATAMILPSLEHQAILEEMLDADSKPAYRPGTEHLHYLLSSPFRYPPLRHGSRFGHRFEPSLFYGGTSEHIALCENAYYRFYFYHDMEIPPVNQRLTTQHTLFEFQYHSDNGVKLQNPPFESYEDTLRDPVDYSATQALGMAMRESGVKCIEYRSARDPDGSVNVALYDASAFSLNKPISEKPCICQTSNLQVVFSLSRQAIGFLLEQFLVKGKLPMPAP